MTEFEPFRNVIDLLTVCYSPRKHQKRVVLAEGLLGGPVLIHVPDVLVRSDIEGDCPWTSLGGPIFSTKNDHTFFSTKIIPKSPPKIPKIKKYRNRHFSKIPFSPPSFPYFT